MKPTVNRKEMINYVAEKAGVSKVEAERIYDNVLGALDTAIQTGKCVLVGDMFRVQATMRAGGIGVNPKTKEKIERQPKPRLKVTLSSMYADKVAKAANGK